MDAQKVLIIGGTGCFGQILVDDLIRHSPCQVVVASRRRLQSTRFETVVADLSDTISLDRALMGVKIAICAAGPFHDMPLTLLQLCLDRGIHYIDFADNRRFVEKVISIADRNDSKSAVCTAWSTVSALSGVLIRIATAGMQTVDSIRIQMAPGNRGVRRTATIASLLHSVGRPFRIFENGYWRIVRGWSSPRDFEFPQPVGVRRGYLIDVPDHDLFPHLFGAKTVEFRAGSELNILNQAVSLLASTRKNWTGWSVAFQRAAALFSWMGHDAGGIGVEVFGATRRRRASIIAESHGERIAVLPSSVMTASLLAGINRHGLVSHGDWLTREQLHRECERRGFRLLVEEV